MGAIYLVIWGHVLMVSYPSNYIESHDMDSIFFSTMVSSFTSLILLILCLLVIKTLYKSKFLTFILFGKHSR